MFVDLLAHIYRTSLRTRRLYIIALSLAAGVVAITLATLWFDGVRATYDQLQDRRATLGNMLRVIEAGRQQKTTAATIEQVSRKIFLQGASKAVVSASLQSWLGAAVQESGAQLQSIENSTLSETDSRSYVGLSASIVGPWRAVQSVIFRIETAEPVLTVQSLELQSYSYGSPQETEPSVTMQISVRGAISDSGT